MPSTPTPDFDARTDFELFYELGRLHIDRAYTFAADDGGRSKSMLRQAHALELELGKRLCAKGGVERPWGAPGDPVVGDEAMVWQNAYEICAEPNGLFMAVNPTTLPSLTAVRLGQKAFTTMAVTNPDIVDHAPLLDDPEVRLKLLADHTLWLGIREEAYAVNALLTDYFGASGRNEQLESRTQFLGLLDDRSWLDWAEYYADGGMANRPHREMHIKTLDTARGTLSTLQFGMVYIDDVALIAPEVLGTSIRLSGARANLAALEINGRSMPFEFSSSISSGIDNECEKAYNDALALSHERQAPRMRSTPYSPGGFYNELG